MLFPPVEANYAYYVAKNLLQSGALAIVFICTVRIRPNMSANTDEVSKHVSDSDCWVIIGEDVYDVTKFLPDHPGGKKAIILLAGKEEQKSSTCYTIARLSKSMGLIKAQLPIRVSYPSE